ncbi:MAG: RluA family pseudouridine synthase [Oscillospiraceae bacterium]|nr:RluA family pseudouridine synthase [Oscillospiraceae bacterium]
MTLKEYTIGRNDAGQRLDRFLTKQGYTIGVIRKALRQKDVKIDSKRVGQAERKLVQGEVVGIYTQSGVELPTKADKFHGVSAALNVVYEDENILLCDKPVGLLCHEDSGQNSAYANRDTLINRIKAYLYKNGEFVPENENSFEPALCNRIDRNTAGIVIAAKNAETLRVMNEKIKLRQVTKLYLCILVGAPKVKGATMTAFLHKNEATNTVKVTPYKTPDSKTIVTKYRILDERAGLSLAEINLLTGRTHQIRAHMAAIGCPLLGDGKYGKNAVNKQHGFANKQALCSYKLQFSFEGTCHLDYLNGRCFEVSDVWFLKSYYDM